MPVTNFPPDLLIIAQRNTAGTNRPRFYSRLTTNGDTYLTSSSTIAETSETTLDNPRFTDNVSYATSASGKVSGSYVGYAFKRAPGFFDVVCYTGNGTSGTAITHNLGAIPELVIVKSRSALTNWPVCCNISSTANTIYLNLTNQANVQTTRFPSLPTSTTFVIGNDNSVNTNAATYVAYLFATLAGISKVGSYTGNGGTQNIECGFAAGARFVLIKRTDSTGDWYVWDTARGIVSANDPHLSLNTTAAEVTTDDSVDPYSAGFAVNQVAATNINVSSATYIFLAVA